MTVQTIPFNRPSFVGDEWTYLQSAVSEGHLSGDGQFTASCNSILEEALGVARALLTTNCTHALEMSALLLDIGPGDEVIVPSFTFVTTALAFLMQGAKPVFADIRPASTLVEVSGLLGDGSVIEIEADAIVE